MYKSIKNNFNKDLDRVNNYNASKLCFCMDYVFNKWQKRNTSKNYLPVNLKVEIGFVILDKNSISKRFDLPAHYAKKPVILKHDEFKATTLSNVYALNDIQTGIILQAIQKKINLFKGSFLLLNKHKDNINISCGIFGFYTTKNLNKYLAIKKDKFYINKINYSFLGKNCINEKITIQNTLNSNLIDTNEYREVTYSYSLFSLLNFKEWNISFMQSAFSKPHNKEFFNYKI